MLPKVANHIFLHTSRAVAAVQNQTSHTIRNVLQLQSSSGPNTTTNGLNSWNGAGSSSWGSNGAGPGGAKFNAGSRFYNGYTGAGRAVTQANASTSQDGNNGQSDDRDEFAPTRTTSRDTSKRTRLRSHSLSLGQGRQERGETLGVLKTVQLHARSRHAFAPKEQALDAEHTSGLILSTNSDASLSPPVHVRDNSTTAASVSGDIDDLPPSLIPNSASLHNAPSSDPSEAQFAVSLEDPVEEDALGGPSELYTALKNAAKSKDGARVISEVEKLHTIDRTPLVSEYNMALAALYETRRAGEPLTLLLQTYNDMVKASVLPNYRTYVTLILALTDRDIEIYRSVLSLEVRVKRRVMHGRTETVSTVSDEKRIEQLKAENNFGSAMALFEAVSVLGGKRKIPLHVYQNLLRSCAFHANIDAAIHVFAHLEARPDVMPTSIVFSNLISVYTNVGDLQGAKEVFNEYREAAKAGRVKWSYSDSTIVPDTNVSGSLARSQLQVWNRMIEAYFRCGQPASALGLLEQMMDSNAGKTDGVTDVPPPASSTFTQIITGFCESGDVATAVSWFDRLLQQGASSRHPFEASLVPSRPDQIAWVVMLENLADAGMVKDLNRLFAILVDNAAQDGIEVRATDRIMVFEANMHYMQSNPTLPKQEALEILDFLVMNVVEQDTSVSPYAIYPREMMNMVEGLFQQYARLGVSEKGIDLAERFLEHQELETKKAEEEAKDAPSIAFDRIKHVRDFIARASLPIMQSACKKTPPSFQDAIRVMRLLSRVDLPPNRSLSPYLLHAYSITKKRGEIHNHHLSRRDYEMLILAATSVERTHDLTMDETAIIPNYSYNGLSSLVVDFSKENLDLSKMEPRYITELSKALYSRYDEEELDKLFSKVNAQYKSLLKQRNNSPQTEQPAINLLPPTSQVSVDGALSRYVDEWYPTSRGSNALEGYARLEAGVASHKYPHPSTIGRLIVGLGRLGEMEKVRRLYDVAQIVLASLEGHKHWQSHSWFQIEDKMIVACAHQGDMDAAFAHRTRITENGGAPSPDAYGSLIENVKDTTDDTSNAMALFREAQLVGCTPNVYLFNTIISKLAKARKADFALELFQQMKATPGLRATSITYGAVIAACARVGDAHSAEQLFLEMTMQPNFRPRIPPYNTMMQMYTHTKPDRERVLHYYHALLAANIQPSAHTYKLLIDAYGTIEPIDADAMENVFKAVESSNSVQLQGSHWAALINAWGCVKKNLDKAIVIFDSISSHPGVKHSATPLPDAVTYEALFNVLVTHKRVDLIPTYVERLNASSVHMTAYIANLLIKGYAAGGNIEQARTIFEGLADPPRGVAAPNNHVPHDSSTSAPASPTSLSYREPSTWESMFRAELGSGNRDRALALLQRLQERQFPPAVYNRIKGIMLDDSVSPWPAP
ncbi:hypothetical protein SERLA73DRAFT_44140 [Serpula lacrymans var. lacrymans S7.3]|uniref:PROP1-like PPR domain-containing protein n=2 Tax=Serpula lacrymans var. lacrymans TaxID=341189 RepID=F8PF86_SERL3|nr:uncharacterized protein SERLADRAFT_404448 [Serpula lacrymans var. lacrymans S7.9]EGO04192.1 hypothetical protein SERLA73DRAFT_44140 [Serpula lacrymans var. lacrymans S7.3]EGO30135.1 hypothetical protein SERLADRAFT_404448 [Serpula lacrymans var. lacrymans S7.9]